MFSKTKTVVALPVTDNKVQVTFYRSDGSEKSPGKLRAVVTIPDDSGAVSLVYADSDVVASMEDAITKIYSEALKVGGFEES